MRNATDFLNSIIDAWEALPGGGQVRNRDVEKWLADDMAPAINTIRGFLRRPKPDGNIVPPPEGEPPAEHVVGLPQDVINLVIAAREFWEQAMDESDESAALDIALEAFSSRVPYENEPDAKLEDQP